MANPHWTHPAHLLVRVSAPADIVTLAEAKAHLEYIDTDRDTYIAALIDAATEMLDGPEGMVGKALGEQVWTYSLRYTPADKIDIPAAPVKALQEVTYYDVAGDEQEINVNQFRLVANEDWAYLEPVDGFVWPALFDRADAVTFRLQLGMDAVPVGIKHAALMMIANWFENREAVADKAMLPVPFAVESLINRWRIGWMAA
jgi:uncharacterized phiE125 gp8 family phage protein